MDIRILEDIGLTNAEIKVYLALLELGTSTAGPVLSKTGLQNSVVHMTLARLIDKGINPKRACSIAIAQAITDEKDEIAAIEIIIDKVFR